MEIENLAVESLRGEHQTIKYDVPCRTSRFAIPSSRLSADITFLVPLRGLISNRQPATTISIDKRRDLICSDAYYHYNDGSYSVYTYSNTLFKYTNSLHASYIAA